MTLRLLVFLLTLTLPAQAAQTDRIAVFADVSVQPAIAELVGRFERATIHRVTPSFGSSHALVQRIENGTHPDLLITAGQNAMDIITRRGLAEAATVVPLVATRTGRFGQDGAGGALQVYYLAIIVSRDRPITRLLYDFLRSAQAAEIYRAHGFLTE